MRLSERKVDDIRIAALLQDVQNVEVTAKVIRRAVGDLKENSSEVHTFQGSDLVQSLGTVLSGALPLIIHETVDVDDALGTDQDNRNREVPFGALILRTASHYDELVHEGANPLTPREAVNVLRTNLDGEHNPAVLHALEQLVVRDVLRRELTQMQPA
jgi:response regulator RpfG family c-di-GMP phosphodiesterase